MSINPGQTVVFVSTRGITWFGIAASPVITRPSRKPVVNVRVGSTTVQVTERNNSPWPADTATTGPKREVTRTPPLTPHPKLGRRLAPVQFTSFQPIHGAVGERHMTQEKPGEADSVVAGRIVATSQHASREGLG